MASRLLLALPFVLCGVAHGQALTDTPVLREGLKQGTDSTIALSAGPEVGTGRYSLKKSEFFDSMTSRQIKLRVYVGPWLGMGAKVPRAAGPEPLPSQTPEERTQAWYEEIEDLFQLRDPRFEQLPPRMRFFALINYGDNLAVSDAQQLPTNGPLPNGRTLSPKAEVQIQSVSLRAGGGVRIDFFDWLSLLPTFTVAYNNVHGIPDGDAFDRAILQRDYSKILVDWRSESFTYIPQIEARFVLDLSEAFLQVFLTVHTSYLTTHVFSATTEAQDFNSKSLLGVILLEFDFNTHWDGFFRQDLHIIPAFRYTRVEGDAVSGLGTNDIFSVELSFEFDTTHTVPFSSRLGLRLRYIFAFDVRAWNIGFSHEF